MKMLNIEELNNTLKCLKEKGEFNYEYVRISRHLIGEELIKNQNSNIRMQTAISICRLISQLDFDTPYEDAEIEKILNFFIQELKNVTNYSEYHSIYFELLKTINETKAFNWSFVLTNEEQRDKIIENLFKVLFDLVEEDTEDRLKPIVLSILKSILEKATNMSFDFLHWIFLNIAEPQKNSRKKAFNITMELIQSSEKDFEEFFTGFVTLVIKEGDTAVHIFKLYDISYELKNIFPTIVHDTILFFAKSRIQSLEENKRLSSVKFLGKMFSAVDSQLVITEPELFKIFLGRISDKNVEIRLQVIEFCRKIILRHPKVRYETSGYLKTSQFDPDLKVRIKGVHSMAKIIFKDVSVLEGNKHLHQFLRGVKSDPEFTVRELELKSLGIAFKEHINDCMNLSQEIRNSLLEVQTRILYAYSEKKSNLDTCLIEKLFKEILVSYDLPTENRMKRLFHLYSTIHFRVLKSFAELQEVEYLNKKLLSRFVNLIKVPELENEILEEIIEITKLKDPPMNSVEFVQAFRYILEKKPQLVDQLEKIVSPHVSCREQIIALSLVQALMSESDELFSEEILMLIENATSFIIDDESIRLLVDYVFEALEGGDIIEELDLDPINVRDRGIKLLMVLANYFPTSFEFEDILQRFIDYLKTETTQEKNLMISLFSTLGKRKSICTILTNSNLDIIISCCKRLAIEGTPKESKNSIRCLKHLTSNSNLHYEEILERMESTLTPNSNYFLGSIIALGHIATERTAKLKVEDLIIRIFHYLQEFENIEINRTPDSDWYDENQLSLEERLYEESIKCITRWICVLNTDSVTLRVMAKTVFSILNHYLVKPYCFKNPFQNRLRAKAACLFLKICEKEELRHFLPLENFYTLSKLMNDQCTEASKMFIGKLIKGLQNGLPERFLTNEFLAFFVLSGNQKDQKLRENLHSIFKRIIAKRNFFISYMMNVAGEENISKHADLNERFFEWLPEYSIIFALPILSRNADFIQLNYKQMRNYLKKFLQLFVESSNFDSFDIFERIGNKLKGFNDAFSSDWNENLLKLNEIFLSIVSNNNKKKSPSKRLHIELRIPSSHYSIQSKKMKLQKNKLAMNLIES